HARCRLDRTALRVEANVLVAELEHVRLVGGEDERNEPHLCVRGRAGSTGGNFTALRLADLQRARPRDESAVLADEEVAATAQPARVEVEVGAAPQERGELTG